MSIICPAWTTDGCDILDGGGVGVAVECDEDVVPPPGLGGLMFPSTMIVI